MKRRTTTTIKLFRVFIFISCLFLWTAATGYSQGPSNTVNISDKELSAFVKAYVEVQKIRSDYEPALNKAKNAKESQRIQQEASGKIKAALEKHGLAVEKYNNIHTAVNNNSELREKTLKLVQQERKKS